MTQHNEAEDDSYEAECPNCGEETTFSVSGSLALLSCDSCTYAPRASVREEIRSNGDQTEAAE